MVSFSRYTNEMLNILLSLLTKLLLLLLTYFVCLTCTSSSKYINNKLLFTITNAYYNNYPKYKCINAHINHLFVFWIYNKGILRPTFSSTKTN